MYHTNTSVSNYKMKRGRKKQLYWKKHVFLSQRANITLMPSKYECNCLKDLGLGESNKIVALNRRWNISRVRQYLCRVYPNIPLLKIGFNIAKCDKIRRLIVVNVNNVEELETEIRGSLLILIPYTDITLPLMQVSRERLSNVDIEELSDEEFSSAQNSQTELSDEISLKSENIGENDCYTQLNNLQVNEKLKKTISDIFKQTKIDKSLIVPNFLNVYESGLPEYLTEEMFTLFWKSAEKKYFRGEAVLVPFVPIHRLRNDTNVFRTLGKILGHMWMTVSTVPLNIARTTYLHISNPMHDIPDNVLLEDMLMFVTQEERVLLKKALNDFTKLSPVELSFIESFFVSNSYYNPLSPIEFREQLLSLASDLIIHKPKELVLQMRKGFLPDSLVSFLNVIEKDQLSNLLTQRKPTVQRVLNILTSSTGLSNEQLKVFYYLQMYIMSLVNDNEQLLKFIFFVSGTVQMPKQICVTFNNATGLYRQIIANKCSCTLELSFTYSCYQEFKRELHSYLSSCLT